MFKTATLFSVILGCASLAGADTRAVFLETAAGERIEIAALNLTDDGTYSIAMKTDAFSDHFLSMRPFKCLDGSEKTWCHVPYPYDIKRDISSDLTDLEYDLLFLWKRSNEYGIDMWNGVYYVLSETDGGFMGQLHEMDMNILSVPPDAGNLRPVRDVDLTLGDVDSHWLPRLVVE